MAKYATTIDLTQLLEGTRTRTELGATQYAMELAEREGTIQAVRPRGAGRGRTVHYKLTRKGRDRARRALAKS